MFGFGGSFNKASNKIDINDQSGAQSGSRFDQGYGSSGSSYGGNQYGGGSQYDQRIFGGSNFEDMYGDFGNMWKQYMGPGGGQERIDESAGGASDFMKRISEAGAGGMEELMSGGRMGATGSAIDPALRESIMASMSDPSQTGRMYESIVGGAGNEYIDPLIARMGEDEAVRQNRSASDIRGSAVGSGMTGSSRHGIAEGLMRSEGSRDLGNREASARAGAYDKDLDWKMKIAEQADLGRGQAQDRAIGLLAGGDENVRAGTDQASWMQNLGMGQMAPWMQAAQNPFQMGGAYSSMMGPGTVLGSGSQFERGSGESGQDYTDTGYGSGSSEYDAWREYQAKQREKSMGGSLSLGM